ncbi:hypothetical protein PHMEG_00020296 [Phytophthora megakarya]|uniref:BED-type domain-containing protein n=1 Tax=Phytophthora megakarya TaxID=4795 RepID=A0A225VP46_9STRA|nr:hypothetical protein PHMEG_00020296 [Phytophthora megakarya]
MVSNKQLVSFFYVSVGQGLYRCTICGSERKQASATGYSNLMAHLGGKHADFEASTERPLQAFGCVSEEANAIFQLTQWILMRNMPLHEVEDAALTRAMNKLRPVTVNAVKKCMEGIAIRVGQDLTKALGTLFGLIFDG